MCNLPEQAYTYLIVIRYLDLMLSLELNEDLCWIIVMIESDSNIDDASVQYPIDFRSIFFKSWVWLRMETNLLTFFYLFYNKQGFYRDLTWW